MGKNTLIEWADDTLNLWWGCFKISPACDHCYADAQSRHQIPPGWLIVGEGRDIPRKTKHADTSRPEIWGADAPRIFPPLDSATLRAPYDWNRKATALGERRRVFVQSMGDVFERHRLDEVNRMMNDRRAMLFQEMVPECQSLDFLLLTKRPHDVIRLVPRAWCENWPVNVWIGCTVEDQQRATQRIPPLVEIPAPVRFISCEPLLGPLDLTQWIDQIDWVIAGGESGGHARPTQPAWFRGLRDQTKAANKSFHFKQFGNWAPTRAGERLIRLATKNTRLLDGRTWDEFPTPRKKVSDE